MTDSTDKPRKTLSITRKPSTQGTDTTSTTSATVKRTGGKRIITRAELPNVQPPGKRTAPAKPAKNKRPRQPPKPKKTPPSVLKARELNDRLNGFRVWLDYLPLAIGVEKDLFRLVNDEQFPGASKRVVQRLLHQHTHDRRYLENVCRGGVRRALNGEEAGAILPAEQEYAVRALGMSLGSRL